MRTEEDFAKGFNCGYDCSMQVLADLAPDVGLTEEQGLKLGACVGVGAGQGAFCGAVTAALIAIGYKYGNSAPDDLATKGICLAKRSEFYEKFEKEFGSLTCPGLLGLDLRKPEDSKIARERDVVHKICPKYCRFAVITVKQILND